MLKRRGLVVVTAVGAIVLAGCSGHTTGTTNIESQSATLNATAQCDAGQTCTWYWEYWLGTNATSHLTTAVAGPVRGSAGPVHLSTTIRGLYSNTTYGWVLCGSPNNGQNNYCVGPSGNPQPDGSNYQDFESFTTHKQPTLAEGWDGSTWTIQPTPQVTGETAAYLAGVSCTSATGCTAVRNGSGLNAVRWDGSSWTLQSVPSPPGSFYTPYLLGVSCPFGCIAVGAYYTDRFQNATGTLAEAWNGGPWTVLPPANTAWQNFQGVSCTSPWACTAVGQHGVGGGTLAERWDGTSWTLQNTPNAPGTGQFNGGFLNAVSCSSATSCTAVGGYYSGSGNGTYETLVEHWDGTSWTIQPTPHPSGLYTTLTGVSCTSATACTAVGRSQSTAFTFYTADTITSTLAERWNGTAWTIVTAPAPGVRSDLNAVSCTSATACTAVGHNDTNTGSSTLAERWDGTTWSVQPTPNPPGQSNDLYGVSCASATACTAVGY